MLITSVRRLAGSLLAASFACLVLATTGSAETDQQLGVLTGRVVDEGGRPLKGVTVFPSGGGESYETRTAADGNYTLVDLKPGRYRIAFFAPNDRYAHALGVKATIAAGGTTAINARLVFAGKLRGTIRDASGRPAEMVRVYLNNSPKPDRLTGRDGSFSIGGLAPGKVRIKLGYYLGGRFVIKPALVTRVVRKQTTRVSVMLPRGAEARA